MNEAAVREVQPTASAMHPTSSAPSVHNNNSNNNNSNVVIHDEGGDVLELLLGTLGLVEMWVLIVYAIGSYTNTTTYENVLFDTLASFELLGYLPSVLLTLAYMSNNTTTGIDSKGNTKTLMRDPLHNLVHPRSAPRSRKRHDFAGFAWCGMLSASIPVVLLLSFYPAWEPEFDDPLYARVVPSVLAVLATVLSVAGWVYLESNRSSYVLTVMYASTKVMSLFVLVAGAERLLLGEGGAAGSAAIGLALAFLQVVKIGSAAMAALRYLKGLPDEDMPKFTSLWKLCAVC